MRACVIFSVAAAWVLAAAGEAYASPPGFPDVDAFPAVDPANYEVTGAHPSASGWAFSTPAGLRCEESLIPDLGVSCQGPAAATGSGMTTVSVSLTTPGRFGQTDTDLGQRNYPLLPVGSKIAPGNGVVCAVPSEDVLVCRAAKPDSWPADTPDPPDRHYGEHGFVIGPTDRQAY